NNITKDDILVHNAETEDSTMHLKLINMEYPEFPVATGVVRSVKGLVYDEEVEKQIATVQSTSKIKSFYDLAVEGDVWEVK
ncbi:MAG TPA: hypothetical protein VKY45_09245, partial [Marinilabiliaceae bacterium]|nr:hypothetical protein [Marinilabiliaceae bacterium]